MSISISCSKWRGLSEEMDVVAETGDEMMKWFGRAAVLLFFCCMAAMGAVRGEAAALTGSVVYQAVPDGETLPAEEDWKPDEDLSAPVQSGGRWLWLSIPIADKFPDENTLFFSTEGQAVRIWMDGALIYSDGVMGPVRPFGHGYRWHRVVLPAFNGTSRLLVQLYADHPYELGRLGDFSLASEETQMMRVFTEDIPYAASLPVCVLMIAVMSMYYFNQLAWKRLNIHLILLLLVLIVWMVSLSQVRQLLLDWPVFWRELSLFLLFLIPVMADMVLYEIVELDLKQRILQVVRAYSVLTALALLAEMLMLDGFHYGQKLLYLLLLPGQAVVLYCLLVSIGRGNVYARFAMLPMVGVSALALFDGLNQTLHLFPWQTRLLPLGVYTFISFVVCMLRAQLLRERRMQEQEVALTYKIAQAVEWSEIDALTGCRNRAAFDTFLREAARRGNERTFSLIMMDIDHFKDVNDTYGHDMGDKVLIWFAELVRGHLDHRFRFFRWGGEEFILYCPDRDLHQAVQLAEDLCRRIGRAEILPARPVTVSMGVAFWHGADDPWTALFRRADEALYRSKRAGRNRVAAEGESPE